MKRKPETEQEIVDALADLLEHDDQEEPIEEVDADLRAAGLDPAQVGARMAAAAEVAYRDAPENWRTRARAERAKAERRLRQRAATRPSRSREEIIEGFSALAARSPDLRARIQAHFRNFETTSDEELADLLDDLLSLAESPPDE